jgi:hypothetical protein
VPPEQHVATRADATPATLKEEAEAERIREKFGL